VAKKKKSFVLAVLDPPHKRRRKSLLSDIWGAGKKRKRDIGAGLIPAAYGSKSKQSTGLTLGALGKGRKGKRNQPNGLLAGWGKKQKSSRGSLAGAFADRRRGKKSAGGLAGALFGGRGPGDKKHQVNLAGGVAQTIITAGQIVRGDPRSDREVWERQQVIQGEMFDYLANDPQIDTSTEAVAAANAAATNVNSGWNPLSAFLARVRGVIDPDIIHEREQRANEALADLIANPAIDLDTLAEANRAATNVERTSTPAPGLVRFVDRVRAELRRRRG